MTTSIATKHPTQVRQVNRLLPLGCLLVKDQRGYFYFVGEEVEKAYTTVVPVASLGALTLDQWLQEFKDIAADSAYRSR